MAPQAHFVSWGRRAPCSVCDYLTLDRRVKLRRFDAESVQDVFLYSGPLGSRMVSTDCYRDVDSEHGLVLEPEILAAMRVVESRVRASEAIERGRLPPRALSDNVVPT